MSDAIIIKLLDIDSVDEQLKIHSAAFGEGIGSLEEKDFWIKKHYHNPLGPSLIFGAVVDNTVVGMNAYMPVDYYANGECIKMLQSCESGVLPSCQGKGIWKKVVSYALKYIKEETDYKLVIGFPNYINSYPGFKKMGWKTVSNMKNYVMINNLKAFKNVFRNNSLLFRIAANGVILQRAVVAFNHNKYKVSKIQVEDLIWSKDNKDVLKCSHSIELLKWKADYKKLYPVSIKEGDKTVATCLYGKSLYNGSPIIVIECFECSPENLKHKKKIISSLLRYFTINHPDVSFIRIWTQDDSSLSPFLKKMLFVSSSHPNPFIVNDPESVYANMPWSLSFFDLD